MYGEVGRLFLQREGDAATKKRKKYGGSGRKRFTEGWIEFKDKRIAKAVAMSLNNTTIGGKRRESHYDEIWNIKYLPKFLWSHLSEKAVYEKVTRGERMRTEISQAKKEANFYAQNVEKGKVIEAKKRKGTYQEDEPTEKRLRTFEQYHTLGKKATKEANLGNKSTGDFAEKSISRDLLRKVFTATGGT